MNTVFPQPGLAAQPTSPYTLVIVDMQPGFPAANDERTIAFTEKEIEAATRTNTPIVFIVSDESTYGALNPRLLALVEENESYNPDLWTVEVKFYRYGEPYSASSGARQVDEACQVFGFPTERFRFCGVNTDICVFFTAMELSRLYSRSSMEIVLPACNVPGSPSQFEQARVFSMYAGDHGFDNYVFAQGACW